MLFGSSASLPRWRAILTVDKLGRKPLLLIGIAGRRQLTLCWPSGLHVRRHAVRRFAWSCSPCYLACFNFSYGSVCWVIVSEIFPTAIRGRAMSISIFSLWTGCTLVAQTFPAAAEQPSGPLSPSGCYGLTTPVAFLFVLFLVPETKGKSLEQIERQFIH